MSWVYKQNRRGPSVAIWVADCEYGDRQIFNETKTNEDKLPKKLRKGW